MIGVIIVTSIALLLGIIIVYVSEKYQTEDQASEYNTRLPGFNCGVCGYGTCQGLAKAMVDNPNLYQKCKPLRGDALTEMENYLKK